MLVKWSLKSPDLEFDTDFDFDLASFALHLCLFFNLWGIICYLILVFIEKVNLLSSTGKTFLLNAIYLDNFMKVAISQMFSFS